MDCIKYEVPVPYITIDECKSSLAYCQALQGTLEINKPPAKKRQKEEGETTMTNTNNETGEQRSYLYRELRDVREEKISPLLALYGLKDIEPKSAAEAIDLIKTDKIVVDEKRFEYYGWSGAIRFRDPALKEDRVGFAAAKVLLDKAVNDVERIIKIKSPDDGLAAVIDFENKTFH